MLRLIEKYTGKGEAVETLTLPFELRQKTRQRVTLDGGGEAGVMLPPGAVLRHGDLLRSEDGVLVRVQAAAETVVTARTDNELLLARACYHLGNRHVPIQVGAGWVRFLHDHVLEEMVRSLGLVVAADTAAFEPEAGAYGEQRPHHGHPH